jgi:hypothetical protein
MTIETCTDLVFSTDRCFAINQITGELVVITATRKVVRLYRGEKLKNGVLPFLFSPEEIAKSWDLISDEEGQRRLKAYCLPRASA